MPGIVERLRAVATAVLPGRPRADPLEATNAAIVATRKALEAVPAERAKALEIQAAADQRRDALLLDGAPHEEVERHDREVAQAHDTAKALGLFERAMQRRLDELAGDRRRILLTEYRRRWHLAATALATSLRKAHDELHALAAIPDEARRNGFETTWVQYFPPPPIILGDAEIERWSAVVSTLVPGYTAPALRPRRPPRCRRLAPCASPHRLRRRPRQASGQAPKRRPAASASRPRLLAASRSGCCAAATRHRAARSATRARPSHCRPTSRSGHR